MHSLSKTHTQCRSSPHLPPMPRTALPSQHNEVREGCSVTAEVKQEKHFASLGPEIKPEPAAQRVVGVSELVMTSRRPVKAHSQASVAFSCVIFTVSLLHVGLHANRLTVLDSGLHALPQTHRLMLGQTQRHWVDPLLAKRRAQCALYPWHHNARASQCAWRPICHVHCDPSCHTHPPQQPAQLQCPAQDALRRPLPQALPCAVCCTTHTL